MKSKNVLALLMAGSVLVLSSCGGSKGSDAANPDFNSKSQPSSEQSAEFLIAWMKQLFTYVASEQLSPPVASRMYAYIGAAIYEAQVCGAPYHLTLQNQLNGLNDLPRPDKDSVYDWTTCVMEAIYYTQDEMLSRYLTASIKTINELHDVQLAERAKTVPADVLSRSKKYGRDLADAIIAWSSEDNFEETRYMQYKAPTREGHPEYWQPTDFNQTALEPFWNTHRTFFVRSADQCDINMKFQYSTDSSSEMYKQAKKVWMTDKTLTEEQRTIAQFWADDPGETFTPPGHWMYIIGNFVQTEKMNLDRAAELYALTATAMADACITVWNTKYRVNLVRPKTYINETFEAGWEPYVETPPFAGYTSGHSGFSGAAAEILTALIGDNKAFLDSSHVKIGLLPREFLSFRIAAAEAAKSRMYGGIHFDCDIDDGLVQGICVGEYVLNEIKVSTKRQGSAAPSSGEKKEKKEKEEVVTEEEL
ncbi:MAG: vanadium-dependent haloperoxidase [Chitinophagales bacterium]